MRSDLATYKVALFSVLKERLGRRVLEYQARSPLSGGELLDGLAARHPAIADFRGNVRLAVNRTYARESESVSAGDEIALITPVSGG